VSIPVVPAVLIAPILLACGCGAGSGASEVSGDVSADAADLPDAGAPSDAAGDAVGGEGDDVEPLDAPPDPCPVQMVLVEDAFCIDRYEAALEERAPGGSWVSASPYLTVGSRTVRAVPAAGIPPQGYISGVEAAAACAASGKRLCTSAEWLAACRGPDERIYPYGDEYVAGACNDRYAGIHPVVDYFGTSEGVWDAAHMNDPGINQRPGTVAPGGAFAACVSVWGVFDLHGNLHEWVADAEGTFRGGFYADASRNGPGCTYVTTAHAATYHDYSTGFRCCAARVR
jgi:hypothetical protein